MRRRQHDAQAERRGDDAPPHVDGALAARRSGTGLTVNDDQTFFCVVGLDRTIGNEAKGNDPRPLSVGADPGRSLQCCDHLEPLEPLLGTCPRHRTIRVRHSPWTNRRSRSRENTNGCLPRTRDRVTVSSMAARPAPTPAPGPTGGPLTTRQRQVLEFIDSEVRQRGYPPSVREIGEAVGLSSPSTVHAHLAALQDKGYLPRPEQAPRDRGDAGAVHRRRRRSPARAPRPTARRRRRRHRRARGRAGRRAHARSRGSHRRRRAVHAARARRVDDRRRHLRR